jgi:pyrroloquinoline quinone biosynthesis protein B
MNARLVVLGTAQDGGFPHAGCTCPACVWARRDPARVRRVSSVGLIGSTGRTLLVDATPDFPAQAAALSAAAGRERAVPDMLVLTHAHMGHYLGLAYLGREAMDTRALPVRCTPQMAAFLRANRPWSHLEERGQVALERLQPGDPLRFDGLEVRAFLSPHRGEDTDTLGFEVTGPTRRVLYVSDADVLPPELVERVRDADVAFVDGTFYAPDELPHRDILAVRHPFVRDSLKALAGARGEVWFTHLNHSNPLLHPDRALRPPLPSGFGVAHDGQVVVL